MAQQVEHVLGKDEVTGSNPVSSSISPRTSLGDFLLQSAVVWCGGIELKRKNARILQYRRFGRGEVIRRAVLRFWWETLLCRLSRTKKKKRPYFAIQTFWQGRRDSNTQPTVLETATLPLSHSPKAYSLYNKKSRLSIIFHRQSGEKLHFVAR